MASEKPIIQIQNLNVTYFRGRSNEVRALRDIQLEIFPGELAIFFGPSGCGKSTLLYAVAGLETHIEGNILVDGQDIAVMKRRQAERYRQKKIGMIFQAFYLINSLTVLKNVILPQYALRSSVAERTRRAKELLEHFGVATQASKLPNELSGGQQQRVAICRALINDPDILLADEPTGNLDSKSAADVMQLLWDLNQQQHKTIVLVTHDPSHLHMAHRVFYMKDGTIIETKINKPSPTEEQKTGVKKGEIVDTDQKAKPSISRELELLIRTYSSIAPGQIGTMLIPFKAKQIVSDVLTGMSIEEIDKIEQEVRRMLMSAINDASTLEQELDNSVEQGGLGLNKQVAKRLAESVTSLVGEIRELQKAEKITSPAIPDPGKEIRQLRQYLLETFNVHLRYDTAVINLDNALKARLANTVDRAGFEKLLDIDLSRGGVGLDKRLARKISRRVELLILGKYNG